MNKNPRHARKGAQQDRRGLAVQFLAILAVISLVALVVGLVLGAVLVNVAGWALD